MAHTYTGTFAWLIADSDAGGPIPLSESEEWFDSIEEALDDAKRTFPTFADAQFIQIFEYPGTSYQHLVADWSPDGRD